MRLIEQIKASRLRATGGGRLPDWEQVGFSGQGEGGYQVHYLQRR